VTGFRPEVLSALKSGLIGKPGIEMVIAIDKPAEAENKINRGTLNILLIDLDGIPPDTMRVVSMQTRYGLHVVYSAFSRARVAILPQGAIDNFIITPAVFTSQASLNYISLLVSNVERFRKQSAMPNMRDLVKMVNGDRKIVAIASSTGGTNALEQILRDIPADGPPIVVVQHMPSGFTKLFAERIDAVFPMDIKEAESGDYLKQGLMLLAPADRHMRLVKKNGNLAVECFTGTKIHGVMPAADVLFESVAELAKDKAIGVILTGMGADGAKGLMLMHNAGATTIGQNKETCVVYGMPKVAKDLGAVDMELPIDKIAETILQLANAE
jgi:two-component system chemotaxis response regulator CheB